jgi:hypothetical protein
VLCSLRTALIFIIGLIESKTISKGWDEGFGGEAVGIAGIKEDYICGDLGLDPFGLISGDKVNYNQPPHHHSVRRGSDRMFVCLVSSSCPSVGSLVWCFYALVCVCVCVCVCRFVGGGVPGLPQQGAEQRAPGHDRRRRHHRAGEVRHGRTPRVRDPPLRALRRVQLSD